MFALYKHAIFHGLHLSSHVCVCENGYVCVRAFEGLKSWRLDCVSQLCNTPRRFKMQHGLQKAANLPNASMLCFFSMAIHQLSSKLGDQASPHLKWNQDLKSISFIAHVRCTTCQSSSYYELSIFAFLCNSKPAKLANFNHSPH